MTTPWPDDVLDCAKRLAKSLGYEDSQIRVVEGRVMIYRAEDESYHGRDGIYWYWHPLDPRDPTVWSALIGEGKVKSVSYWENFSPSQGSVYAAKLSLTKLADCAARDIGIAVCEAYNALKGNPWLRVSV
jgi:hypothetical protein